MSLARYTPVVVPFPQRQREEIVSLPRTPLSPHGDSGSRLPEGCRHTRCSRGGMVNPWEESVAPPPDAPKTCTTCKSKDDDEKKEENEGEDKADGADEGGDDAGDGDAGEASTEGSDDGGDAGDAANDNADGREQPEPVAAKGDQALATEQTQRFDDGSTLTTRSDGSTFATERPAEITRMETQRFDDGSSLTKFQYDDGRTSTLATETPTVQRFDDGSTLTTQRYTSGHEYTTSTNAPLEKVGESTQYFDDGSSLRTTQWNDGTTTTYGSRTPTDMNQSMDFIQDARTATPDQVRSLEDTLANARQNGLTPSEQQQIRDFLKDYHEGRDRLFDQDFPDPKDVSPRPYPETPDPNQNIG